MSRRGFTLIEVVLVVMVGAILTTIGMNAFGNVARSMRVSAARNAFVTYHARARASAIEFGANSQLFVDTGADTLAVTQNGRVRASLDFMREFNTDVQGSSSTYTLCMNPRGYAEADCNSFNSTVTLVFTSGGDTASVQIRPLGQLVY